MFALKGVAGDGTERQFRIDQVRPLGFGAFRDCVRSGRRSSPVVMWGTPIDGEGNPIGERVRLRFPLEFKQRLPFYGLVEGGVVPPMCLPPASVLVLDRNVGAALTRPGIRSTRRRRVRHGCSSS